MNLESASYVAGIVGCLGTLAGLYFAWQAQRLKREGGGPIAPTLPPAKKDAKIREVAAASGDDALRFAFASSKKIQRHSERDAAFIKIARKAVNARDWRLALEIAESLTYATSKDATLREIVDAAVRQKEWQVADVASDLMFYVSSKDSAKRAIADSATK